MPNRNSNHEFGNPIFRALIVRLPAFLTQWLFRSLHNINEVARPTYPVTTAFYRLLLQEGITSEMSTSEKAIRLKSNYLQILKQQITSDPLRSVQAFAALEQRSNTLFEAYTALLHEYDTEPSSSHR